MSVRRFVAWFVAFGAGTYTAHATLLRHAVGPKLAFWIGVGVMAGLLALMCLLLGIPLRRVRAPRD